MKRRKKKEEEKKSHDDDFTFLTVINFAFIV
jgi:hypothetical protein